MRSIDRRIAQEAKAMTKREVMVKAIEGRITWLNAADILGVTARHMRRLRQRFEQYGWGGLRDQRVGNTRRKRVPLQTIEALCRLRRERYDDYSVLHFWQTVTEKHGIELSYSWTKQVLFAAGLAHKAPGRGKYRRKRERRPMVGMLMHLDASTHRWLPGLPMQDLVVALDDADGRILYARFVEQEGTLSTMQALLHVVTQHGRFCELYTDRGSHFCKTSEAGADPDEKQQGQVTRALKALGIRQILARSPEARGRSERAFGTIQGRLPQELRAAGISRYPAANAYLQEVFVPDFNRRFTVRPAQKESAFCPVATRDLELLLSAQHERIVHKDNTVHFYGLQLQLEPTRQRLHYVRCPVLVHEFFNDTLGVSYQGRLIARYSSDGTLLTARVAQRSAA
jgi:transposase